MKTDIYVAPWLGEFGWEVAVWVPWLRHHVRTFLPHSVVKVFCRPGHAALYEDFAEEVSEVIPPKGIHRIDCENFWLDGSLWHKPQYHELVRKEVGTKVQEQRMVTPPEVKYVWNSGPPRPHFARYHQYGLTNVKKTFLAIHARNSARCQDRNWALEKWNILRAELEGHVVAIGSKEESLCPPECEDLRGLPLSEVMEALSRSKAIIGPSSGPLPLANFCGTPAVWWSPNAKDVERFDSVWNPFRINNERAAISWDPNPEQPAASLAKVL